MLDPEQPDPALGATVRLRIGEPLAPSAEATQQLAAGEPVEPASSQRLVLPLEATQPLTAGEPADPSSTQRLVLPMEATQPLFAGEPMDPASTQRIVLPTEATKPLRAGEPMDPTNTQRMVLPVEATVKGLLSPLEGDSGQAPNRTNLNLGVPPVLVQTSMPPTPVPPTPVPFAWKLPAALVGLIALGVVVFLILSRLPVPPPSAATPSPRPAVVVPHAGEALPASVQAYVDKAQAGDVNAMRMLGAMYYNGLDVPRDPVKGLAWYRKAAEQGSIAARAELDKLEQSGK